MQKSKKSMVHAAGAFVFGSLMTTGAVQAVEFQATELSAGYELTATEASCGADKAKKDDKTDTKADKTKEGKCGEGKCGEGKCGADQAKDKTKETKDKAKEGKCGEGKCGEGKCGGLN